MSDNGFIHIHGGNAHNLKDVDIDIPRRKFVVITGISGSGKSSLAFDTIYAEGQRRYLNTLSPYAKHFIGVLEKPAVESIEGLSPIIAIEQKTTGSNPRSTVGTITEISDFLRLLYARIATAYSPMSGKPMVRYTDQQIVDLIMSEYNGRKCILLAPMVRGRKGHYRELFDSLRKKGFTQARIDSVLADLNDVEELDRYKAHFIELVVDKLKPGDGDEQRIRSSVETALGLGKGCVAILEDETLRYFSKHLVDPDSGISMQEPAPHSFSFNSPEGYCPYCKGLGSVPDIDMGTIVPDRGLSIARGGIAALGSLRSGRKFEIVQSIARKHGFSLYDPIDTLPDEELNTIVYGTDEFFRIGDGSLAEMVTWPGIIDDIEDKIVCPACHGSRLKPETEYFKIDGKTISEVSRMEVSDLFRWIDSLPKVLDKRQNTIARDILKELHDRIEFLIDVGLDYLSLDRATASLSGGESQRIRLSTQIGSKLVNVIYILDEPSIGLHQKDNRKLIASLRKLRDEGNTVIVVEHDAETMASADFLIDVGPGAGSEGGRICFAGETASARVEGVQDKAEQGSNAQSGFEKSGTADERPASASRGEDCLSASRDGLQAVQREFRSPADASEGAAFRSGAASGIDCLAGASPCPAEAKSLTLAYIKGERKIEVPGERRKGNGKVLSLKGACGNNLRNIDIDFPLGCLIGISGVSGSGKSTLINETLMPILKGKFYNFKGKPLAYSSIEGLENIDKVIEIDQSPIGRTPRSNPATFTGVFNDIRDLFEETPDAKVRGFKAGRFSFNVAGGRCEECKGAGLKVIEMNFLPSVNVVCPECGGKRYKEDTLAVKYKGKSINDVLEMPVAEAYEFFKAHPKISAKLKAMVDVGLGYVRLGQSSVTLSGGESQRMKLASELFRPATGNTLYMLDEPTTGLHFEDIKVLLGVLQKLVDNGNTVIIIEHNLDVLKSVDYLFDMGPEGGRRGGLIVAQGTPEQLADNPASVTGKYLKEVLN